MQLYLLSALIFYELFHVVTMMKGMIELMILRKHLLIVSLPLPIEQERHVQVQSLWIYRYNSLHVHVHVHVYLYVLLIG